MIGKPQLTRRNALKLLAAASGAALGSAFLPAKWTKPIVETGVLPVHAQSSLPNIVLTELDVLVGEGTPNDIQAILPLNLAIFTYADPAGLFTADLNMFVTVVECNQPVLGSGNTLKTWGAVITGTPYAGTVEFSFDFNFFSNSLCHTQAWTSTLSVYVSGGSRTSNQVTGIVQIPN